jgi:hypothetical protein
MMCFMYFLYLLFLVVFLLACDCSLRCVVSYFILCVVPSGFYPDYYLEYWVVSLVMHVVRMDSYGFRNTHR